MELDRLRQQLRNLREEGGNLTHSLIVTENAITDNHREFQMIVLTRNARLGLRRTNHFLRRERRRLKEAIRNIERDIRRVNRDIRREQRQQQLREQNPNSNVISNED